MIWREIWYNDRNKMKILHIATGLQKASGVTTFVENVVQGLRALGHEVEVLTKKDDPSLALTSTLSLLHSSDIVHLHGLWDPWLLKIAMKVPRGRLVWSTHGMTAPWSLHHKWWKKFLVWHLAQKPLLKRAALIHSTVEKERDWNAALGFKHHLIAPLGTTLPQATSSHAEVCQGFRTLLFVGRVYPVKALDNLIKAFSAANVPGWRLRIVGPDQAGHMVELQDLCTQLGLNSDDSSLPSVYSRVEGEANRSNSACPERTCGIKIVFAGPKFGSDLDAEYASCDALALVSHTENFGATVVDAMAHSKPVITSTNTPWKEVSALGCGYWVDNDVETLAATLRTLFNTPASTLEAMGARGRALVEAKYTWSAVAKTLADAYLNVI